MPLSDPKIKSLVPAIRNACRNQRFFVVEDDEINLLAIRYLLQDFGATVDGAESAIQALKVFNPDASLVFCDLGLPDLDGLILAQKLRETYCCVNTPIIALTGRTTPEVFEECINAGMNDILKKPVTQEAMARILYKWLVQDPAIAS